MEDQTRPGKTEGAETKPTEANASDKIKTAASDVKHVIQDAASNLKTTATEQTAALKDTALSAIGDAQTRAADQAKTAASTLRQAADGLEGELPWVGTALNKTAEGLEGLTSALASGDLNDALDAVKGFAKRQPALFLGLSVAAGFAFSRIGKTALTNNQPDAPTSATNGADGAAVGA